MDDSYFEYEISPDRFVCLSPLSKDVLDDLSVDGLGDDFGYFIYESVGGVVKQCVSVLAKCPSYEAALRLLEIYRMDLTIHRPLGASAT